jgi:hypothetical protein
MERKTGRKYNKTSCHTLKNKETNSFFKNKSASLSHM